MADVKPLIIGSNGLPAEIGSGNTIAVANGGTGQTTLAASIEALLGSLSTTQGVLLYRAASAWAALAVGTAGQVLSTGGAGANPSWITIQLKMKSSLQNVNNSTTLTNDNHLVIPVAANKSYKFIGLLFATWSTGSFKYAFTTPSGATGKCWLERAAATNNVGGVVDLTTGGSTSATNLTNAPLLIAGNIDNGSNAGNLQFQFAQSSQQANNTTLNQGSAILFIEG